MRICDDPPIHLTYCLNVHPGERWKDNLAAIEQFAKPIARQMACKSPFGLGLRIGHTATEQLDAAALESFRADLDASNLYAFTINGFPYGQFHDTTVKENVYRPDWTTPQRRDYTNRLGEILAALLPDGATGSISTSPIGYKMWFKKANLLQKAVEMLAETAFFLSELHNKMNREIVVALEPEPSCLLETTDEVIDFFAGPLRQFGATHLCSKYNVSSNEAERILRQHLGVCFDTAHQACQFEPLADSLLRLQQAGVRIAKVQISSALSCRPTDDAREALKPFCDPVYLHQTNARTADGRLIRLPDLADALTCKDPDVQNADQWRVHFHVPLFAAELGGLGTTQNELTGQFAQLLKTGLCPHLEIETYTWTLLPNVKTDDALRDGIIREFQWVQSLLA